MLYKVIKNSKEVNVFSYDVLNNMDFQTFNNLTNNRHFQHTKKITTCLHTVLHSNKHYDFETSWKRTVFLLGRVRMVTLVGDLMFAEMELRREVFKLIFSNHSLSEVGVFTWNSEFKF